MDNRPARHGNRASGAKSRRAASDQAREKVILSFQEVVKSQARRLLKSSFSHVPLEDLVSEGQLGLLKAIKTFDPKNKKGVSLKVWVIHTVRYTIIDGHRRRHYRNDTAQGLDEDLRSETPDLEHAIIQGQRVRIIRDTLRLLPERSRVALETYRSGGLLKHAAAKLGLTESAVCLLRQQARNDFKQLLDLAGVDARGV